jgi:serine/threonine protein kinase/outer membrane protein assembly factor BamB
MGTDSRIGTEIAGYRIESVLGRGGMGVVYLAEDTRLGRKVALKLLSPDLAADDRFRDRFVRESRVAASIEDPNIVPIHEAGEADGVLFIAMRYVRGTDLETLLEEGPVDPARAVGIVSQAARGLDAAHREGLVHRDVKPGNILLVPGSEPGTEHVYLSDFGLTKRASSDSGITGTGQFVGTLDYAAPEQFTGEPLDARTDVYSLGCVLYECLTGAPPYRKDRDAALMYAHLNEPPPKPTAQRPELPAAVDDVVATAMAKSPDDRYPTAGALAAAARDSLPAAATGLPAAGRRRRRAVIPSVAGAVAAVVVVAIVAVLLSRGGSPATTASPGPPSSTQTVSTPPLGFARGVVSIDPRTGAIDERVPGPGQIPVSGLTSPIVAGEGAVWTVQGTAVVRIDPATGEVTSIPVNLITPDVAVGQGAIWALASVALGAGGQLIRIDPATSKVADEIDLPNGGDVRFVEAVPGAVWVAGQGGAMTRVDPGSDHAGKPIQVATSIDGLAFGGGALWVLDRLDATVLKLDPDTGGLLATFPVGGNPSAITVGLGSVWVADGTSGTVARLDPDTGTLTGPIRVGEAPVAITTGFGDVWVANQGDGTLSRIDPVTNDATEITVGTPVAGIAADTISHRLWVVVSPRT